MPVPSVPKINVTNPVTVGPDATIAQLDELCGHYKVSGLPVIDAGGNLQENHTRYHSLWS